MNKLTLFSLILVLASPFSVGAGSISSQDQTEQTEVAFEVFTKSRQQNSILAGRKSLPKSKYLNSVDTVKLVIGVSSRPAKNSTSIYLRKCTLLI